MLLFTQSIVALAVAVSGEEMSMAALHLKYIDGLWSGAKPNTNTGPTLRVTICTRQRREGTKSYEVCEDQVPCCNDYEYDHDYYDY